MDINLVLFGSHRLIVTGYLANWLRTGRLINWLFISQGIC
jgi:hypothetical protein